MCVEALVEAMKTDQNSLFPSPPGYSFQRTLRNFIVTAVMVLLYGLTVLGALLPGQHLGNVPISWQSHLFGLIGGVVAGLGLGLFYRKYPERYTLRGTTIAASTPTVHELRDPSNPFSSGDDDFGTL